MKNKLALFYLGVFVFLFSSITLYWIGLLPTDNDLNLHNDGISKLGTSLAIWPPHFLYFTLVFLISGFSTNLSLITVIAAIVLGIAVAIKAMMTFWFLTVHSNSEKWDIWVLAFTIGLVLFTNMPSRPPWTHELPPISWQNSSTVFLFPFALWLFYISYKFIQQPASKALWQILVLGIISLLIKPNFILVFGVVFPFAVLFKFGFKSIFWKVVAVHLVFAVIMVGQFYYTFEILSKIQAIENYNQVKVVIAPFKAWAKITRSIPISFVIWAGYPITFLTLYYKKISNKKLVHYALNFFLVGFFIFILLNEETVSGSNVASVNFLWQAIITHFILSVICLKEHLNLIGWANKLNWKDYLILGVFGYFALSGIMYLINTVYLPSLS